MLVLWFIIFKPWLKDGFINIRRVYTEMPVLLLSHLSKWIERFRLTLTISHFTTVICTDGVNKIFFFCFLLVLWLPEPWSFFLYSWMSVLIYRSEQRVVLTHRGPCECPRSSLHPPQLACRILAQGRTPRKTAWSPGKAIRNKAG